MKNVLIFIFGLVVFSCGAQDKSIQKAIEDGTFESMEEPTNPKETEFYNPVPPTVNPVGQNGVPSDAIVLFDGSSLSAWERVKDKAPATWKLNTEEKSMTVNRGGEKINATIQTKKKFGSVQLHLEWKSPKLNLKRKGQQRGNSGVFLQGRYEVQVLDNNDNDTYVNGQVGSIYKQSVPLAKASVPTGEWNSYDIIYHAPEFDGNKKVKSGTITVLHNGVLVQDHHIIKGTTAYIGWPKNNPHGKGPIKLQDHGDAVGYRNIWVRELD
ncbi:DUF1080 domain-containing protein [Postechiella marina]|uniref:DUF1080 domain-containing protein n=1 Tax=Postechiella marina TaxID=943941 RepID=A0ABP8C6A2_9FLAO